MVKNYYEKYIKNYQKTPKGIYGVQRANAIRRKIPWEFTFDTWWKIWETSGKWNQRGTQWNQYCMARILDFGPYSPENVEIITMSLNSKRNIMFGKTPD